MVVAVLEPLADVADEIVIAADARVDSENLRAYGSVADKLFSIEYPGSPGAALEWLATKCEGDYIFRIDGDEVVSPALVDALPELVSTRTAVQHAFARRWLTPGGTDWIEDMPWHPNLELRLSQNDATLRYYGRPHTGLERHWPTAYWFDLPIYHLVLALADEQQRQQKIARYELRTHGALTDATGESLNGRVYQPELNSLRKQPIPPADVAAVSRALLPDSVTQSRATKPISVSRHDVLRHYPPTELAASDYDVAIALLDTVRQLTVGERRQIFVSVENRGSARWPWGDAVDPAIRLAHRWIDCDGNPVPSALPEWARQHFSRDINAGEAVAIAVDVAAPTSAGSYILEMDVVHEFERWFEQPVRFTFDVVPRAGRDPARVAASARLPERTVLLDSRDAPWAADLAERWGSAATVVALARRSDERAPWDALLGVLAELEVSGGLVVCQPFVPVRPRLDTRCDDGLVTEDGGGDLTLDAFGAHPGTGFASRVAALLATVRQQGAEPEVALRVAIGLAATGPLVRRATTAELGLERA